MANSGSIDAIIEGAVRSAVARVSHSIARIIAEMAASELEAQLAIGKGRHGLKAVAPSRSRSRPRRRPEEMNKWVADKRARRVPKFVIELTGGLDTKKKIVAKFGENASFERGRPLPKPAKAA